MFKKVQKIFLQIGYGNILFALAVLLTLGINIYFMDVAIDADTASEYVLGWKLFQYGEPILLKNWIYSTEIKLFYMQIPMAILFHFIQDFETVRLILTSGLYLILALVYYLTMKNAGISNNKIGIGGALLFVPFSAFYNYIVFSGCFYLPHIIYIYLTLYLVVKSYSCWDNKKVRWIILIISSIVAVGLGASGVRYLMNLYVPLAAAMVILALMRGITRKKEIVRSFAVIVCNCFFAIVGYILNIVWLSKEYIFVSYGDIAFQPISNLFAGEQATFATALDGLFSLLGYQAKPLFSAAGVLNCFVILVVFGGAYITYQILSKYLSQMDMMQGLLFLFGCMTLLVTVFVILFTDAPKGSHYFLLPIMCFIPVVAIYMERIKGKRITCFIMAFILIPYTLLSYYSLISDYAGKENHREGYVAFLEEAGLPFGYADFWDANNTTYLLDGEVEVESINVDNLSWFGWLADLNWQKEEYYTGEKFILLRNDKVEEFEKHEYADVEKAYSDDYYTIYTFEKDIVQEANKNN